MLACQRVSTFQQYWIQNRKTVLCRLHFITLPIAYHPTTNNVNLIQILKLIRRKSQSTHTISERNRVWQLTLLIFCIKVVTEWDPLVSWHKELPAMHEAFRRCGFKLLGQKIPEKKMAPHSRPLLPGKFTTEEPVYCSSWSGRVEHYWINSIRKWLNKTQIWIWRHSFLWLCQKNFFNSWLLCFYA